MVATGAIVADAAAEWLRYVEHDRACKPSTLTDYRHTSDRIMRDLGQLRLEDVTPELLERWKGTLNVSNRMVAKYLVILHGIFRRAMKVWGLPRNPAAAVERPRYRVSDDLDAFSPEEVWALVRAAWSEKDGALFLTAAFTGLRMGELLALEWRDVDFGGDVIRVRRSYNAHGGLGTPKSGKVRSVPMVPDVAQSLASLTGLVFARCGSTISDTPSGRWRCAGPRCRPCRPGWATRTFRRPCATRITAIAVARRGCWLRHSPSSLWTMPQRPAHGLTGRAVRTSKSADLQADVQRRPANVPRCPVRPRSARYSGCRIARHGWR